MINDGIDELKAEIDALHARIDAQRAIFTVLITALEDAKPGAQAHVIAGLESFERALRMTNERDAVLKELRDVREILERVGKPEGSEEDE
jgi:hypothetical protein